MAATLVEGQKYGLDSNVSTRGNKTFIHFKLTDSALRAIEDFTKIKGGCTRKPSIQFTNNTGVMSIPCQVSSDDPKAERRFHFSVAKLLGDANGSFDCVQETKTRHGSGLNCLGSMQHKVTTNANNDVYSDTRKKIAIADNESKKICAKEIKMSGRFSGMKIKKVIPSSQYNAGKIASSSSSSSSSSHRGHHSSSSSSHLASSSSSLSLSTSANSSNSSSRLPSAPPPSSNSSSKSPNSDKGRHSSSNPPSGRITSIVSSNNGILQIGNGSGSMSEIAQTLSIKDRVVHLLAIRSYKKPEIVVRLMRDGIHEKDRASLDSVLKEVSVVSKDGRYNLAPDAWQYFRFDWPLYDQVDKDLAKRNRQAAKSRSSASISTSGSPPIVCTTSSPSPPQKRPCEDLDELMFISKKHHKSQHPPRSQTSSSRQPSLAKTNKGVTLPILPALAASGNKAAHHSYRTGGGSTGSVSSGFDSNIDSVSTVASGASDKDDSPLPESPGSNCENQGKGDDSSLQDYMLHYSKIETCDQWLRYKEDFNKEYNEYHQLRNKLADVSLRFEHLGERINNTQQGSETFEELYNQLRTEYNQTKSDSQFVLRKQRMDYLHKKLGYIKQLIIDYYRHIHLHQCS